MKKTYQNPTVEVVIISGLHLMAGSFQDETTGAKFSTAGETGTMDARDYDFDED